MLGIGFSRALTRSGFQRRATAVGQGLVVYRLADGSGHVGLPAREWDAFGDDFVEAARPIGRTAMWLTIGLLPAAFIFGMTVMHIVPGGGWIMIAAVFLGPPAIYLWQSYRIKAVARSIEVKLMLKPLVEAPPSTPTRPPRWLEVAFLLLVGPGLIIQVYGSFNPDAFRNTPWSGMSIDGFGVAGFAVLGAMLVYWRRARQEKGADVSAVDNFGGDRRQDMVARARSESA